MMRSIVDPERKYLQVRGRGRGGLAFEKSCRLRDSATTRFLSCNMGVMECCVAAATGCQVWRDY